MRLQVRVKESLDYVMSPSLSLTLRLCSPTIHPWVLTWSACARVADALPSAGASAPCSCTSPALSFPASAAHACVSPFALQFVVGHGS